MAQQVARGREVVLGQACAECHGGGNNPAADGWLVGSKDPAQDFVLGPNMVLRPRNLTPDSATGIGKYSERQIFNALRYGLRPSKTADVEITSTIPGQGNHPASPDYLAPLMPWPAWRHLPDQDLWAIAAYLKRGVKPVSHVVKDSDAPPDRWLSEVTVEKIGPYPARPHPTANETAVQTPQVMLGRAIVIRKDCGGCHGGGSDPAAKGWLVGMTTPQGEFAIGPFKTRPRNITPDNETGIGRFTERQIFNSLRYGLRPGETPDVDITSTTPGEGNFPARPKYLAPPMPWGSWRHSTDEELWAIAAYLKQGVKPVSNRVADSEGPPDFWADTYSVAKFGGYPAVPFPTANERGLR
jgi:mono/diheme cytochrome c family protein